MDRGLFLVLTLCFLMTLIYVAGTEVPSNNCNDELSVMTRKWNIAESKSQDFEKKNIELRTQVIQCEEKLEGLDLKKMENRVTSSENREKRTSDKLEECEKKVKDFQEEKSRATDTRVLILENDNKNLREDNSKKDKEMTAMILSTNELGKREVVCQANYTNLVREHAYCNTTKVEGEQENRHSRDKHDYKNIFLAILSTSFIGIMIAMTFCFCVRTRLVHPHTPVPPTQPMDLHQRLEALRTLGHIPALTAGENQMPTNPSRFKFDITFMCPDTEVKKTWLKEVIKSLTARHVTVNPIIPTEFSPVFAPSSKCVIFLSEDLEGPQFFCINQRNYKYFFVNDAAELMSLAEERSQNT